MPLPTIIAHGTLGQFDELIYLGIAAIFVVIMVVAWLRSRTAEFESDDADESPAEPDSPERFKLD